MWGSKKWAVALDLNIASSPEKASTAASAATSESSVLNAERPSSAGAGDDDDSCSTLNPPPAAACFRFGILTRQLFSPAPAAISPTLSPSSEHLADLGCLRNNGGGGGGGATELPFSPPLQQQLQIKKSRRGPRSRSSQYRGVTFYRRTGRWESHIWDCGKQVYLGGFDTAHAAARAYDRAAIKFRGVDADINFNLSDYDEDLKQMPNFTKEEFVHLLRRQGAGFSRGSSKYRGVTLHKCGRWEARMGQYLGKKAYDRAVMKCNGRDAVTNFEPSAYEGEALPDIDLEVAIQGGNIDLDLNLSIAQPAVHSPKRDNSSAFPFHSGGSIDASYYKKARTVEDPSRLLIQPHHRAELSHAWAHPVAGFFHIEERNGMEQRDAHYPPPPLPSWAQHQMHGRHPTEALPLFPSAASSGFSGATTAVAAPSTPSIPQPSATSFGLSIPHYEELMPNSCPVWI